MYKKPLYSFDRPWQAIAVTFAAENARVGSDEKTFELGAAVAEIESQLKDFRAEYDRKSRQGASEDELALFWRRWEETVDCPP